LSEYVLGYIEKRIERLSVSTQNYVRRYIRTALTLGKLEGKEREDFLHQLAKEIGHDAFVYNVSMVNAKRFGSFQDVFDLKIDEDSRKSAGEIASQIFKELQEKKLV
jgi:hypothetical protein